ncbi:hypothetical protein EIP86_008303 [Pleurotus ostreatoroseus]|nr:hypothetical protein EIP86_008303 [Pleurotus ostreatoroseus]
MAGVSAQADAESLQTSLKPRESHLIPLTDNLVDKIWEDRPARPANKVFPLDIKYSGEPHVEKISRLREELKKKNYKAMVVSMLDEVAWLFNLRGADIDFNPVFFAYAVVTQDSTILFVNPDQVDDTVRAHLGSDIEIKPYDVFFEYLSGLGARLELHKDAQVVLGDKTSLAIAEAIGNINCRIIKDNIVVTRSPVADMKAIKNKTEVEGFRQSHIRDGVALARYFAWLQEQLNNGVVLTESEGADQLEKYRSYVTQTSSSYLGAKIVVGNWTCSRDYLSTRFPRLDPMEHFGTPTAEEKRAFTRVLQGHIAIDTAIFPNGTSGYIIDSFARRPLWEDGLDYRHGTGHGVGHFLNVHEGPQGIGVRIIYNSTPLKVGMTVSNEPGYYADGSFGIRIENVVVVREANTPNNFGNKGYLGFEHLTMSPMHKNLIDVSLLSASERAWVDSYHAEVWEKVSPLLQSDSRALSWLKRECSPL